MDDEVNRQLRGLARRVRALEERVFDGEQDDDDEDAAIAALFEILVIPCDCARMRVMTEMRQHVEIAAIRQAGQPTSHWLGCHVAIAGRGLGARIHEEP
jgi:hypothetical protein